MKKLLSILCAGIIALSAAACSSTATSSASQNSSSSQVEASQTISEESSEVAEEPTSITVTHELGTVEIPYNPQNIVVLDLAVLDILDNLGLGDRVTAMPKSSYVSYLYSYVENEDIKNVGSLKEVDMESIYALQPDVIFIGGRLSGSYEELSEIAPVVLNTVDNEVGYIDTFKGFVMTIASIFGLEDAAAAKLADFDARIEVLKAAAEGNNAIVGLVTSGSLNTVGSNARCSLISNEIGFLNLSDDVDSSHGDTSSFELVLEKNPDYIFILDRDTAIGAEGASTAIEVMDNEIIQKTDAYQNDRIIYLTPDVWYLAEGGITATDTMLTDLENGILN